MGDFKRFTLDYLRLFLRAVKCDSISVVINSIWAGYQTIQFADVAPLDGLYPWIESCSGF